MVIVIPLNEYVTPQSIILSFQHNFKLTREAALNLYSTQFSDIFYFDKYSDGLIMPFSTGPRGVTSFGSDGVNIKYIVNRQCIKTWIDY